MSVLVPQWEKWYSRSLLPREQVVREKHDWIVNVQVEVRRRIQSWSVFGDMCVYPAREGDASIDGATGVESYPHTGCTDHRSGRQVT